MKYPKNTSYIYFHFIIFVGNFNEWKGSKDRIELWKCWCEIRGMETEVLIAVCDDRR